MLHSIASPGRDTGSGPATSKRASCTSRPRSLPSPTSRPCSVSPPTSRPCSLPPLAFPSKRHGCGLLQWDIPSCEKASWPSGMMLHSIVSPCRDTGSGPVNGIGCSCSCSWNHLAHWTYRLLFWARLLPEHLSPALAPRSPGLAGRRGSGPRVFLVAE